MSGEFARIDADVIRLKSTMDRLLASVETLQDAVDGGASRVENVEAMLQQFMDYVGDWQPPPRDSGDVRERQLQKSQLTNGTALWKKMASRKHWVLRGRIPPNIGTIYIFYNIRKYDIPGIFILISALYFADKRLGSIV